MVVMVDRFWSISRQFLGNSNDFVVTNGASPQNPFISLVIKHDVYLHKLNYNNFREKRKKKDKITSTNNKRSFLPKASTISPVFKVDYSKWIKLHGLFQSILNRSQLLSFGQFMFHKLADWRKSPFQPAKLPVFSSFKAFSQKSAALVHKFSTSWSAWQKAWYLAIICTADVSG